MKFLILGLFYFLVIHVSGAEDDEEELRTFIAVKKPWNSYADAIALSPTGFKDLLIRSNMIVDKSLFIREILTAKHKLKLLTCPRKWGKSMNLDMLRTFLQIEIDSDGYEVLPQTETRSYKLFKNGEIVLNDNTTQRLRHPLLISKHDDLFNRYQGKYPVVYVNFTDFKAKDYQQFITEIGCRIGRTFKEHDYVSTIFRRNITLSLHDTSETKINLNKFEAIMNADELTGVDLDETLRFLTEMIQLSIGKRSLIFVDDYEAPLMNILLDEHFDDKVNASRFYQRFMAFTFELNYHLEKAILTGTLHIVNSIDGLSRFKGEIFYQSDIYQYYGFTEMELTLLCERLKIPEKAIVKLARWYNGYRAGEDSAVKLFNPFSVINFLLNRKIRTYWTETEIGDEFLNKLIRIESIKNLFTILKDERDCSYDFENLYIEPKDFDNLEAAFIDNKTYLIGDELSLKYLYSIGYLTLNLDDSPEKGVPWRYSYFKFPNKEICQFVAKKLESEYPSQNSTNTSFTECKSQN